MRKTAFLCLVMGMTFVACAQVTDSLPVPPDSTRIDTTLRIINLNPYFTLHVDSMLNYKLEINRQPGGYHWYLKNSPVGLRINKDNGVLSFKAEKSFFLSGKLKYDQEYDVRIGVQSLINPTDRVDTSFKLVFYNTEILPSRVKPTIAGTLNVQEGETVTFKVQCESGSFPIESILFSSSIPIKGFSLVKACDEEFTWTPDYDFVNESDSARVKIVQLSFSGATRFKVRDTATVKVIVHDALNYPLAREEYNQLVKIIQNYILSLKFSFLQLDKRLKRGKNIRTTFDLTSGATALAGTILNTSSSEGAQKTGKILPGVGVALVPIKEAVSPNKIVEQNQAALIRTSIKRLEYILNDNYLVGEKDPEIQKKTAKLRDELRQVQIQLIEIPLELTTNMTEEELNRYFNNPRVNKKYRLKAR